MLLTENNTDNAGNSCKTESVEMSKACVLIEGIIEHACATTKVRYSRTCTDAPLSTTATSLQRQRPLTHVPNCQNNLSTTRPVFFFQ